jgi:hypothetical protein
MPSKEIVDDDDSPHFFHSYLSIIVVNPQSDDMVWTTKSNCNFSIGKVSRECDVNLTSGLTTPWGFGPNILSSAKAEGIDISCTVRAIHLGWYLIYEWSISTYHDNESFKMVGDQVMR